MTSSTVCKGVKLCVVAPPKSTHISSMSPGLIYNVRKFPRGDCQWSKEWELLYIFED